MAMERTPLGTEELSRRFQDLVPPMDPDEARLESSRCLFCHDAPCTRACPTGIDVPRFIRQILHEDTLGAAETILDANVLGGSCARACPTEVLCEGACVDQIRSKAPIPIGRLQRYATDAALASGIPLFEPGEDSGRRVAIVGAGPAGLSAAFELRRMGHAVSLFEARDVPGGLNTLGIAYYKITPEFSLREIQPILDLGVDLRLNWMIDGSALERLLSEYDAVFLAVGLGATRPLGVPGEDIEGVLEGLAFIEALHTRPLSECPYGRRVVVFGGGNTAIDAATQARRLGAEEVVICYRRGPGDLPAYAYEQELAREEGIRFEFFAQPVEFLHGEEGLAGVRCVRTRLEGRGRTAEVHLVSGSDFVIPCDLAIKALGQQHVLEMLRGVASEAMQGGRLIVDPHTKATRVPKLYAGGDCTSNGREIVHAVQDGKLAAQAIDAALRTPPLPE